MPLTIKQTLKNIVEESKKRTVKVKEPVKLLKERQEEQKRLRGE